MLFFFEMSVDALLERLVSPQLLNAVETVVRISQLISEAGPPRDLHQMMVIPCLLSPIEARRRGAVL